MEKENFMPFFYELLLYNTAYIVGGYFRDFLHQNQSRDIDIIVDIPNVTLSAHINSFKLNHTVNRHGGIKIKLKTINVDIWSIDTNWAFKNKLVRLNEADKLNSIAKGCFYNFDALVINLSDLSYNLQYYKQFWETKKLDILQKNSTYKNLNPSVEANILRAFYLQKEYKILFTNNTRHYLIKKIGAISDFYNDAIRRLCEVKEQYPKYNSLTQTEINDYINNLKTNITYRGQTQFDF